jgi:hypothetical protein
MLTGYAHHTIVLKSLLVMMHLCHCANKYVGYAVCIEWTLPIVLIPMWNIAPKVHGDLAIQKWSLLGYYLVMNYFFRTEPDAFPQISGYFKNI